ncbi:MAG TPA: protein kinase, partial [Thermoanaerobaculia bacterium]|nr:protein kinase [Thermoanaerobaculia bacterium]
MSDLLRAVPSLQLLVTSRERLHLTDEREYPVPPLKVPDPDSLPDDATLSECPAVALFLDRARAADPRFTLTPENARPIAEICRRLDGLPLAIELAAARLRIFPPAALLSRLEKPLALLTGGPADRPERQRTMRGAIAWGVDLLDEKEKRLFERLAVFAGGFTFDAAEAVASGEGVDASLDAVASLVDKSLVTTGDDGRLKMLETIRELGNERLDASPDAALVKRRHLAYFTALAEEAEREIFAPGNEGWVARLEREHDNLRAALRHALDEADEPATALQLAGAIYWFWYLHGWYGEGRRWLTRALLDAPDASPRFRARALVGAGVLSFLQCDYAEAEAFLGRARDLADAAGERRSLALAFQFSGSVSRERGDLHGAVARHEQALAIFRELADEAGASRSRNTIAFASWLSGDFGTADRIAEETRGVYARLGDVEGAAWALLNLGGSALYGGDLDRARRFATESLTLSGEAGFKEGMAWAFELLGRVAKRELRLARARTLLGQ